jgi:hypothetical protein
MKYSREIKLPVGLRGMDLLDTPVWNKGTAFDDHERVTLGLNGSYHRRSSRFRNSQYVLMKPIIRRRRISDVTSICVNYRIQMKLFFTG